MPLTTIVHNHPIHYKHLLFSELAKQGLDFEVLFTGASSGRRIEVPLPSNGEYRYRIGWDGPYEEAAAIHTARFVWRTLSELRPRVVIISGYYDAAAWTAWFWALQHKAGTILWAESNEFDHPRRAWKELPKKLFVSQCDLAHVYGRSNREYIRKLGMTEDRIFIKRAVADTELFLADDGAGSPKPSYKVLLYVGRFSPEKNLACLLRAFQGVRQDSENPRMVLDLAGYGPQEDELRGLAKALGISPLVRFRGKFPQAELPAIYRSADAFILPSLVEPWGLVANEAMLCGLPVLVSTQCGCAVDLVRAETGWMFSPHDEARLVNLLEEIAETPREALEEMGREARMLAAEYSPRNSAAIVAGTVRTLLELNRNPQGGAGIGARVALLTSSVSRRAGGVFDAVRNLAGSLRNRVDYPVQVFGLQDRYTEADRGAWGDVPVSAFDVAGPAAFGFAPGLERALEAAQPRIVHVHGLWMYPSVASLRWAKRWSPYIISPHGMLDPWAVKNSRWKKRIAGALYENRHLRGAVCLHALHHAEAEAFRAYGLRNPVCVVPNGVEIPVRRAAVPAPWKEHLSKDARVLFYIGRLHPKKALDTLLRGWSLVQRDAKSSGWHLAIGGWDQGGHERELRALSAAEGLDGRVHFIGPQFGEWKAACFQAAEAFILPSLSEGLPMTVLEAWANGLPVLMTRQCNLPHGFQAGAALRIEPEAESIAAELRVLFEMGDADRKAIGERGLALVKERHRWPAVAAQMAAVYEWALGAAPAPDCLVN